MGSVARHQTAEADIPSAQGLHRLEPFEEPLTGGRRLKTARGSQSIAGRDVAALDRFGGLTASTPRLRRLPLTQRGTQFRRFGRGADHLLFELVETACHHAVNWTKSSGASQNVELGGGK